MERKSGGRLGSNPAAPLVASRRSSQEKEPWKSLPGIEGSIEREFLHPILLGESIVPYGVFREFEGIVPITPQGEMLDAAAAANRGLPALQGWMRSAEQVWTENRRNDMRLVELFNYINQLSAQFPIKPLRVVYAASGSNPAATVLRSSTAIVEHKLYWSAPASEDEAHYLAAILNSETARALTAGLQSRGQFGARDFDKVVFSLPIPRFDAAEALHRDLAEAARAAEAAAAAVELPEGVRFQRARKLVRDALVDAGTAPRIDALVARLLDR